jgi:hypothetical protein
MCRIFISYRREDSQVIADRISGRLKIYFCRKRIFKDTIRIPPGADFRGVIADEVHKADVFLAIIGKRWVCHEDNNWNIDNDNDWIRIETEAALNQGILVIPILVDNAKLPKENQLPETLRAISNRQTHSVRNDPDFDHDMKVLGKVIMKHCIKPYVPLFIVAMVLLLGIMTFSLFNTFDQERAMQYDGGTYTGEIQNRQPDGQGEWVGASGSKYIGEWFKGERHGQGTEIWPDGKKYIGDFRDDQRHGKGIMIFPDGRKLEGFWQYGEFVN